MCEKERFAHFARGVEPGAPANLQDSLQTARAVRGSIGEAVDTLIKSMRDMGLDVDACDGAYQVEAALYAWIKKANPGHPGLAIAEANGRADSEGRKPVRKAPPAASTVAPEVAWEAEDRIGEAPKPLPAEAAPRQGEGNAPTPFEQFVASGREVSDLSEFVPDVVKGRAGILYDAGRYIEQETLGTLYLRLGNQEFAEVPAANRRRLEAILYAWAVSDGAVSAGGKEQRAASEAAHYICSFAHPDALARATKANLQELTPGICHMQDVADVWPILDKVADEGTNLELAYELTCGLLALE